MLHPQTCQTPILQILVGTMALHTYLNELCKEAKKKKDVETSLETSRKTAFEEKGRNNKLG
jgi:hypothetical protein